MNISATWPLSPGGSVEAQRDLSSDTAELGGAKGGGDIYATLGLGRAQSMGGDTLSRNLPEAAPTLQRRSSLPPLSAEARAEAAAREVLRILFSSFAFVTSLIIFVVK
jgi:hypothetical protein